MGPFERYPEYGGKPLGRRRGSNARQGYGLQLRRETGETTCAYCGLELFSTYERWLTLQVDHVVPLGVADGFGIPRAWSDDLFNLVFACAACNGFDNRYHPVGAAVPAGGWTVDAFVRLRDEVFADRAARIAARHAVERAFFDRLPDLIAPPAVDHREA